MKTAKSLKTAILATAWLLAAALPLLLGAGRLAGLEALIVQSGSMWPGIPAGSLVVADTGCSYSSVEKGDIIIFQAGEGRVMHRVYAVTEEGFETKGDANRVADGITTTRRNFRGRVVFHAPYLGFLAEGMRRLSPVAGAILVYLLFSSMFGNKEGRQLKKELR